MITLDYFRTHPLRIAKDQSFLTVGEVLASEEANHHADVIHPTAGAYIHYGGVELADTLSILKPQLSQDRLKDLSEAWRDSCGVVCKQLLYYTWKICSKEMRYVKPSMLSQAFHTWDLATTDDMGPAMDLCAAIGGKGLSKLKQHPDVKVGPYMKAVERQFRHGGWSGAYGGPKWADITLEMVRYFHGETSAMLAADRLWSAVHNTGPIFNKGFYFTHHDNKLMKVLNAQASTSVFTLGTPTAFLGAYDHIINDAFCVFVSGALAAIKTVNPDYVLGAHGGVNSDGTKPEPNKTTNPKGGTALGPYAYSLTEREDASL